MFFGIFKGRNRYGLSLIVFSFASFFMLSGFSSVSHIKSAHAKPQKKSMMAQMDTPQVGASQEVVPEAGAPQVGAPQVGAPQEVVPEGGLPQVSTPQVAAPQGIIIPEESILERFVPPPVNPQGVACVLFLPQGVPSEGGLPEGILPQRLVPEEFLREGFVPPAVVPYIPENETSTTQPVRNESILTIDFNTDDSSDEYIYD